MPWMIAITGIVGSIVGVSGTVAVAWINQKTLNQRELLREEIRKREMLYGEFIAECARLLVDALQHRLEKPDTLLGAYALVNRIRLCASQSVVAAADLLLARITDQYFSDNRSLDEVRQLARSSEPDPLREFGEACRMELEAMRRGRAAPAAPAGIRRERFAARQPPISDRTATPL